MTSSSSVLFAFPATNNKAEYEALILGLRLALAIATENVEAMSVSQLVMSQVNGSYEAKEGKLLNYLLGIKELITKLLNFKIIQIPK